MNPARYSVIRYIPDPARNEPYNVGILVWYGDDVRLRVDEDAASRVARDNPHIERDGLRYLEPMLIEGLVHEWPTSAAEVEQRLKDWSRFPVFLSEPRQTMIDLESEHPVGTALDRLVKRIVRPRHRFEGGRPNAVSQLARLLRPFVTSKTVSRNYAFADSRSGVIRSVQFYANSGVNIALDALPLAIRDADKIRMRADAEAYKIVDIREANDVRFVVFCEFHRAPEFAGVNQTARQILESAGASVVTEPEAVTGLIAPQLSLIGGHTESATGSRAAGT